MSECPKPNMSGKKEHEGKRMAMLATKSKMREVTDNLHLMHFVLLYKDAILSTNNI